MNKWSAIKGLVVMMAISAYGFPVVSQVDYTDPKQYNPRNDPDVQRGYDENQEKYGSQKDDEGSGDDDGDGDDSGIITRDLTPPTQSCASADGTVYKCN